MLLIFGAIRTGPDHDSLYTMVAGRLVKLRKQLSRLIKYPDIKPIDAIAWQLAFVILQSSGASLLGVELSQTLILNYVNVKLNCNHCLDPFISFVRRCRRWCIISAGLHSAVFVGVV